MTTVRLATTNGSSATLSADAVEVLRGNLRGALVEPGNAEYDEVRVIWNGMMDKRPALIARCQGTADVIAAVNFAREHDAVLSVRGGGHNVAGHASCDGGLMVDLSLMNAVRVDPSTRRVRAQGGALLGDLDRETQVFGLSVPAGVVSTTGVGGLTLGGGTGWQTRKYGLTIDNLVSVDIVTADGQARVASEAENPNLFWAVRGGGGNFGIVTSFEYQAHPTGPMVWVCAPFYPHSEAGQLVRAFRDFMADAAPEFGCVILFWSVPVNPYFPEEHHGKSTVVPFLVYSGELAEGERLTEPFRKFGKPLCDLSGAYPWTVLQTMFDPFVPKAGLSYYWKNLYLRNLDDEVIDHLIATASTIPSPHTYLVLQPLAGAIRDVPAEATAFGPRTMNYMFEFDSMWKDPADAEENISWTRRMWSETQRYSTGGLYINFPGFGEEGEDLVRAAVGKASYDRLSLLKAQYDPTNLFRLNQNILPRR